MFRGMSPTLVSHVCSSGRKLSLDRFSFGSLVRPGRYFILGDSHGDMLTHCGPFARSVYQIVGNGGCKVRPQGTRRDFTFRVLGSPGIGLITLAKGTKANGALLTLTTTLNGLASCGRVLLTHPMITLSGGSVNFLPKSTRRGITPCVRPLFSGLGMVGHRFTAGSARIGHVRSVRGDRRLMVRTLTFVHKHDLDRVCYVVSRTRGLAPGRVGAVVAHTKRNAGVMFAKSVRRVSRPCLSDRSGKLMCVVSHVGSRGVFTRIGLLGNRHDRLDRLTDGLLWASGLCWAVGYGQQAIGGLDYRTTVDSPFVVCGSLFVVLSFQGVLKVKYIRVCWHPLRLWCSIYL